MNNGFIIIIVLTVETVYMHLFDIDLKQGIFIHFCHDVLIKVISLRGIPGFSLLININ